MRLSRHPRSGIGAARLRRSLSILGLALLVLLLVACEGGMSTTAREGSHNDELWTSYWIVLWLGGAVFVGISLLTLGFALWFRERPGRAAKQYHGNTRLEVVWTIVPVVITAIIMIPSVITIYDQADEPPDDALKVEVIGHQWWFEFRYPEYKVTVSGEERTLTTANELHIPEGRSVDFTLLSQDVIHSFWVPQLAGKVDMVPGHANKLHFTAFNAREQPYLGQCAEFCGTAHANMRFRVFVHTAEDFDAWVRQESSDRTTPSADVARRGEEAFLAAPCIGCHTVQGTIAAAQVGPNLTHFGSRSTVGAGILENTPENLRRWIRNSPAVKPGSKMPPMGQGAGGTLTEEQINLIVAYLQSLK